MVSYIDFSTAFTGASNVSNQTAPEWFKLLVGALPDLKVGLDYLKAHGTKSSFAYATAKTYRFPILGGTHSAFTKRRYSYGDLVGASFRKITTDSARGGFWWNVPGLIVVGGVVVLSIAYDALIRWITGYDE